MTNRPTDNANIASLRAGEPAEPVARFLGLRLMELTPGYARVVMKLGPQHVNFNGLVFGGVIAAVADQALAYASNSLVLPSVASQLNIHFIAGPKPDDELIGECHVLKSGRRVGIAEMTVTTGDGRLVAKATATTIPTAH